VSTLSTFLQANTKVKLEMDLRRRLADHRMLGDPSVPARPPFRDIGRLVAGLLAQQLLFSLADLAVIYLYTAQGSLSATYCDDRLIYFERWGTRRILYASHRKVYASQKLVVTPVPVHKRSCSPTSQKRIGV
jgi:hypothetical protein